MLRMTVIILAAALATPLVGCSSNTAIKRSVKATTSLDQTRTELARVHEQTTRTIDSLKALESAEGELRGPFNTYVREVNTLSGDIERARARFRDFRDRAEIYIRNWQEEAAAIQSEGVRTAAEQRSVEAQADFEEVTKAAELARELVDPLMTHLFDLQTAFENDLTALGIDSLASEITEADLTAMQFKRRVAALQAEIDALKTRWSRERPAAPAEGQAASPEATK